MDKHNSKPSAKLLTRKEMPAPEKIRKLAGLGEHERVFRIVRLRFGNSHPLIIERSYFSHSLFSPIADLDLEKNSIYGLLCAHTRSEEHTSELQSRGQLVCRLL